MENKPNKEKLQKTTEAATKILAILGLIAILGVLSYGIVKIAPRAIHGIASGAISFTSVFKAAPRIEFISDKYNVNSGEQFTLSWKGIAGQNGSYTISYPCQNGVHMEAVDARGTNVIFCNTSFYFLNENDQIVVSAFSNQAYTTLPITLHFTRNGESKESGRADITIGINNSQAAGANANANAVDTSGIYTNGNNDNIDYIVSRNSNTNSNTTNNTSNSNTNNTSSQTRTQTTNSTVTPTNTASRVSSNTTNTQRTMIVRQVATTSVPASDPNGYVDLVPHIIDTGTVDRTTNVFTHADQVKRSDRAGIRFEVVNEGTKTSREWTFAAVLPTFPDYIFQSEDQAPLAPGDRIQFTIGFDSIKQQPENTYTLNVDPLGSVMESNKNNNILKGKIFVNLQ